MNLDIVKIIAQNFKQSGYEVYEVGGSVRDSILGRKFSDIDFAVSSKPADTFQILKEFCDKNINCSTYTAGMEYGTIGLAVGSYLKLEFTTYRGEVYPSDSRKPVVNFGSNLLDDLARRDFTINAIAREVETQKIIDPFSGMQDIKDKKIRCVGSDERLNEDPLRMMRAIRFSCQLGFDVDVTIKNPERLQVISFERIRDEFNKILLSDRPVEGVKLLCDMGLMNFIIPELLDLRGIEQGHAHVTDAFNHILMVLDSAKNKQYGNDNLVLRLAAFLHDIGKSKTYTITETGHHFYGHHLVGFDMTKEILDRLKYDNDTIDRVSELVLRHMELLLMSIGEGLNNRAVARLVRRFGNKNIDMLVDLVECDLGSTSKPCTGMLEIARQKIKEVQNILPEKQYPISGNEIMDSLGLKEGKIIGEVKEYLLDCVVSGIVGKDDKVGLLKLAKEKYG
jgi:putative nucleotidyltransferase with HDIG domain